MAGVAGDQDSAGAADTQPSDDGQSDPMTCSPTTLIFFFFSLPSPPSPPSISSYHAESRDSILILEPPAIATGTMSLEFQIPCSTYRRDRVESVLSLTITLPNFCGSCNYHQGSQIQSPRASRSLSGWRKRKRKRKWKRKKLEQDQDQDQDQDQERSQLH